MKVYTISGEPISLARPRFSKGKVYDSQMQEKLVCGLELRVQHGNSPFFDGPLHVHATFYMPIPSYKRRKVEPGDCHYCKPDVDNLIKFLLDVSNGILFEDDALVSSLLCSKIYDNDPRTEFTIRKIQ